MINWLVRLKNKAFWVAIIPMILLLVQKILAMFGIAWDSGSVANQLVDAVEVLFVILGLLGVVNDPTTTGITDSSRAMTYTKPNPDK